MQRRALARVLGEICLTTERILWRCPPPGLGILVRHERIVKNDSRRRSRDGGRDVTAAAPRRKLSR